MKHAGTKTLETNRLVLRRFEESDATAMYQNWAGDPQVTKYLMWPTHENIEVSAKVLKNWSDLYENTDYYHWAITVKAHGTEPIGSIAVMRQDDLTKMAHIGYCLGRAWWRQGITSEALKTVIHYLFTTVGVNRIESRHTPDNPNSGKVMQKCGMTLEGVMRESDWNNQGICDACMYAVLRKEYRG